MLHRVLSKRALSIVSLLGVAAGSALAFGALTSASRAQQAPVAPPAVAISRTPLELDPAKWVGCHRVEGGALCAPAIQTGTPAIQEQLRAQQAAAQAARSATPPPATAPQPMACGKPLAAVNG